MHAAKDLIEQFKKIRTLPHIVAKLIQLVNDEESTLQDFEAVIRLDPALVARLLTLVNSSYFGLTRKVDSISRAVALLGMKNLHNIAVTDAVQGMLRSSTGSSEFSPSTLWLHSAASGICCKMIAERIFTINGDDAYLCGILHDIGLIVELEARQETFLQLIERLSPEGPDIIALEQELFGADHCQVGAILAGEWRMSDSLTAAIRDHHQDDQPIAPQSPTGILQMSEYIINRLGFAIKPGLPTALAPNLAAHIQASLEEYGVLAEDLPEELEKTKNLYGS